MKVVLKKDVKNQGKANEIIDVAPGYARNYLIPRGLAVPATEGEIKAAKEEREAVAEAEERRRERGEALADKLRQETFRFEVKAGETGRLYGSITAKDIAEAVSRKIRVDVDKRDVLLDDPIRELGAHVVDVKLGGGVRGQARVVVEPEE
jgi:large subunit ribosomal protein L9